MIRILVSVAAAATLMAACGDNADTAATEADRTAGPVVSAPAAPGNEAVDTNMGAGETAQTPGASSYTEGQARSAIEAAGYTGVGALTQNADGVWQGMATMGGAEKTVSVDYKGVVTAQ